MLYNIEHLSKTCFVASRQVGKTVALSGAAYAWALWKPEQTILIVSTGENHAQEILNRVRWLFKNSKVPIELDKDSKDEIRLRHNGSRIISRPSNPRTLRGYSPDLVLIDEVAAIDDWEEMRASLFPTVSQTGGHIVLSSTFKGKNHFWDLCMDRAWNTKLYPWWVHPSPIIEEQRRVLPIAQFAEEYECVPIDEFHSLFPLELIEELTQDDVEEWCF